MPFSVNLDPMGRLAGAEGGPLLRWYEANGRRLPWRETKDPYAIWVSEVMLQQTQVSTALPYYDRWLRSLPTLEALAAASDDDVLTLWQGLGYYRRCRLLRDGARFVLHHGFPQSAQEWLSVPGVGPYTAAAIASICFDEPVGVVDGNVERVYARLAGDDATGSKLTRRARAWAQREVYAARPGDWNQAVMELGATICTARSPKCEACPLSERCVARQTWQVERFPVRTPKPPTIDIERHVTIMCRSGRLAIRRIADGQWWAGMWEFPWQPQAPVGADGQWWEHLGDVRQAVTHHRLHVSVWLGRPFDVIELDGAGLDWCAPSELENRALPALQRKALRLALPYCG